MDAIVQSLDQLNITKEVSTVHTIVLLNVPAKTEVLDVCEKKNLILLHPERLKESASTVIFNENKYFGTICLEVAKGNTVIIPNASDYINKKGNLTLVYHLISRLAGTSHSNYNYIVISEKEDGSQLLKWAGKYAKCMTLAEFTDYEMPKTIIDKPYELKVTCGLLTKHLQDKKEITGHVTRDYNIGMEDATMLEENNKKYVNNKYKATIVQLTLNDEKDKNKNKPGGSILDLPDLGEFAHVTNNTAIKSSLSKAVLSKFEQNVLQFNLQEIDKTAKINPTLTLTKVEEVEVEVIGWYCYALESK